MSLFPLSSFAICKIKSFICDDVLDICFSCPQWWNKFLLMLDMKIQDDHQLKFIYAIVLNVCWFQSIYLVNIRHLDFLNFFQQQKVRLRDCAVSRLSQFLDSIHITFPDHLKRKKKSLLQRLACWLWCYAFQPEIWTSDLCGTKPSLQVSLLTYSVPQSDQFLVCCNILELN